MKYLFSIAILLLLSSCSYFFLKSAGINNPKFETITTVKEYAYTLGIHSSELVFAKDSSSLNKLTRLFNGNPEILIFDKNKVFYSYKSDSLACNASIESVLKNICSISKESFPTKRKIDYTVLLASLFDPYTCLHETDLDNYDFIVFFNFAKYATGLNKTHIIPWIDVINKNQTDCKVKYVFVNVDYLNTWGLNKNDLPKFKVKF